MPSRLCTHSASGTNNTILWQLLRQSGRIPLLARIHPAHPSLFARVKWAPFSLQSYARDLLNREPLTRLATCIVPLAMTEFSLLTSPPRFHISRIISFVISYQVSLGHVWPDGKNFCYEDDCHKSRSRFSHWLATCPLLRCLLSLTPVSSSI